MHKFRTSLLLSAVLSAIARKAACRVGNMRQIEWGNSTINGEGKGKNLTKS